MRGVGSMHPQNDPQYDRQPQDEYQQQVEYAESAVLLTGKKLGGRDLDMSSKEVKSGDANKAEDFFLQDGFYQDDDHYAEEIDLDELQASK